MPNYAQKASAQSTGTDTTIAASLSGITAGRLIVVLCCGISDFAISTVTDDLSVAGVKAVGKVGLSKNIEIWYFKNHGGGSRTFTVTFAGGVSQRSIVVLEYAGRDTVSPFDVSATGNGQTDSPTLGPVTPAQSSSLIVGYMGGLQQPTEVSPFQLIHNDTVNLFNSQDFVQSTAGSLDADWTLPAVDFWAGALAVFKPAPPPPGPYLTGTALDITEGELKATPDKTVVITLTGGLTWIA